MAPIGVMPKIYKHDAQTKGKKSTTFVTVSVASEESTTAVNVKRRTRHVEWCLVQGNITPFYTARNLSPVARQPEESKNDRD